MCLILLVINISLAICPKPLHLPHFQYSCTRGKNIYTNNGFKLKDNYFENKHIINRIPAKRRNDKISGVAKA